MGIPSIDKDAIRALDARLEAEYQKNKDWRAICKRLKENGAYAEGVDKIHINRAVEEEHFGLIADSQAERIQSFYEDVYAYRKYVSLDTRELLGDDYMKYERERNLEHIRDITEQAVQFVRDNQGKSFVMDFGVDYSLFEGSGKEKTMEQQAEKSASKTQQTVSAPEKNDAADDYNFDESEWEDLNVEEDEEFE